MSKKSIDVIGAGITGLWQALTLARAGHKVRLIEASSAPFSCSASVLAGAMLAPYCEAETCEPLVQQLGLEAMPIWLRSFPQILRKGSLVVANARDRSELKRFARLTQGHAPLDGAAIAQLEPDLQGRFASGLYFTDEAHMAPHQAMHDLLQAAKAAGAAVEFGVSWRAPGAPGAGDDTADGDGDGDDTGAGDDISTITIDCRGMGARALLPDLRGVRGERIIIRSNDVKLSRPVRLLHPRHPLYIVPWPDTTSDSPSDLASAPAVTSDRTKAPASAAVASAQRWTYMIGSTLLESEDTSAMTLRSALEILGLAYALHPAFAEAEILDMSAGLRPAFPDNSPKIIVQNRGRHIHVNGMYRHGFLVAPIMAQLVADYLASGTKRRGVFEIE